MKNKRTKEVEKDNAAEEVVEKEPVEANEEYEQLTTHLLWWKM